MKKIWRKIVIIMVLCTLLTVTIISSLSIGTARKITNGNSVHEFSSLSDKNVLKINSVIDSIQQTVNMLSDYAEGKLDDPEAFRTDASYVKKFTEEMKPLFHTAAARTNGAMSIYIRYNPDFTESTSGLFLVKNRDTGDFGEEPPTDFSAYDPDDSEHVGWYYIPVKNNKATWMPPYENKNIDTYMISYVIPLNIKGVCYGVIGMDIDFSMLRDMIGDIKVYDTGYAFLLDEQQNIMIFPNIEIFTPISNLNGGKLSNLFIRENIGENGLKYEYNGTRMNAAVRELDNGMILVLSAPVSEIFRDSDSLTWKIIMFTLLSLAVVLLIAFSMISRTLRPVDEDPLTGTDTREVFLSRTGERLGVKRNEHYAFIMLDIDHFKKINDTYGHDAGDDAIRQIAENLNRTFAADDLIGRFGGDEFLVFMQGIDKETLEKRLEEFRSLMKAGGHIYANPLCCSIGIVYSDNYYLNAEMLLKEADAALYKAKKGGRDRYVFYSE